MVRYLEDRELLEAPTTVWEALDAGDAVAIVTNGQPRALVLPIEDGDVEAAMRLVRRIRAQRAMARMHATSAALGNDTMTDEEINAEIAAARAERRARG